MPTIQNDFLPFATGPGANVVDQATYAALAALTAGFVSGTAQSGQLNKVWRQSSIMSAVIAQFIVAQTGQAAVDDGTTPTLLANFTKAVNAASKQRVILTDTGSVNALAAANAVPMTALPTVSGVVQTVAVKVTNTGAATYSPDGLASRPIFGLGGAALQGGEMVANGIATLVSYVGPLLNGGALCWVLFECIGGAQQISPATQSQHSVQLGQLTQLGVTPGRLLRTTVFRILGGVQQVSVNGSAFTSTGAGTFTSLAQTSAIRAVLVGGGGGSAGVPSTGTGQVAAAGGGAGGVYGEGWFTSGFSGGLAVTVGVGGAAGAAGLNNGGSGGTSSLGSLISVGGGNGSNAIAAQAPPIIIGAGVSTTIATGVNLYGNQGAPGSLGQMLSTTVGIGGSGGANGAGWPGPVGATVGSPGIAGTASIGVGASGGSQGQNGSALAGAPGGPGMVAVFEYA